MTPTDPRHDFIVALGRALHEHGASTARVEDAMTQLAKRFGIEGQFFVQPTSLFAAFGAAGIETRLVRLHAAEIDLSKLVRLDRVLSAVARGEIAVGVAKRRLDAIVQRPARRHRGAIVVLGHMLAGAAVARFLGGAWREVITAMLIGLIIGALARFARKRVALGRVLIPLSAFVASFLAVVLGNWLSPQSPQVAMIAGLVVLLPGLTLTIAISELATNHLASGTARAAGAIVVLMSMGFGVAFGARLAAALIGPMTMTTPKEPPDWTLLVALLGLPLSVAAISRAPWREVPFMAIGSIAAYYGAEFGQSRLGPELGAFLGALVAGLCANSYARWRYKPSAIIAVPALLMLVPGSVGLRSVNALFADQVTTGIETAFSAAMIALALGTGMLVAGVIVPSRRVL
jgi:uncharacterized membrane protein YjjP (DUF1212 family)